MKLSKRTQFELRVQHRLHQWLVIGIVAVLAGLSQQHNTRLDWTKTRQHSLSEASLKTLEGLQGSLQLTVFMREAPEPRKAVEALIERYQAVCHCLSLAFVNPDTQPDRVRALNIRVDGETLVEFQGRSEQISPLDERSLTSAIQRLISPDRRRVVFLQGHGERSPESAEGPDYKRFAAELERKGLESRIVQLPLTGEVPKDTDLLVLAGPRQAFLPGEVARIMQYVEAGGNLLWLPESSAPRPELAPLSERLALELLPGMILDASTQLLGMEDPSFALVMDYPPQALTHGFQQMTVFPSALALAPKGEATFETEPLLLTLERSWTERGPVTGKVGLDVDKGERQGPLTLGLALSRPAPSPQEGKTARTEQRIVVIGDSDFLSNTHLGLSGNLELGIRLIQWLTHADSLIELPRIEAPDRKIDLSPLASGTIAVIFLVLLPLGFLSVGAWVWYRRRRR